MELTHYPYRLVQKVDDLTTSSSTFLKYKLLYTFKSPKSHQWYWVWVEVYESNFYAVKFHLKANRNSPNKYSLMTGLNEARSIIKTCIAIMQDIANENPHSSFGFIGANMQNESVYYTKRFRVYSRIMSTYFGSEVFEHFMILKKSTYLMVRKSELKLHPNLMEKLNTNFKLLYDYFD